MTVFPIADVRRADRFLVSQEYYLGQLSAPRPGRGPRQPFSSDVDLAKMGSGGGEYYGSGSDGEAALSRMRRTSAAFSNQLFNALVCPPVLLFRLLTKRIRTNKVQRIFC